MAKTSKMDSILTLGVYTSPYGDITVNTVEDVLEAGMEAPTCLRMALPTWPISRHSVATRPLPEGSLFPE